MIESNWSNDGTESECAENEIVRRLRAETTMTYAGYVAMGISRYTADSLRKT